MPVTLEEALAASRDALLAAGFRGGTRGGRHELAVQAEPEVAVSRVRAALPQLEGVTWWLSLEWEESTLPAVPSYTVVFVRPVLRAAQ